MRLIQITSPSVLVLDTHHPHLPRQDFGERSRPRFLQAASAPQPWFTKRLIARLPQLVHSWRSPSTVRRPQHRA